MAADKPSMRSAAGGMFDEFERTRSPAVVCDFTVPGFECPERDVGPGADLDTIVDHDGEEGEAAEVVGGAGGGRVAETVSEPKLWSSAEAR